MIFLGSLHGTGGYDLASACALAAAASGDIQFIAGDGSNGFTCVQTTTPATPILLGDYGGSGSPNFLGYGIDVCVPYGSNYAYVAAYANNSFTVVDITDPYNPHTVAHLIVGHIKSICVVGAHAYVVAATGDFYSIDISDPLNPAVVGSTSFSGINPRVCVGPTGYVIVVGGNNTGDGWLHVIDVSDPTLPTEVGTLQDPGFSNIVGLAFASVYAFTSDQNSYIVIVDLTNPGSPSLVSSTDTGGGWSAGYGGNTLALNWSGRRLFISSGAFGGSRILKFNVSSLAAPVFISDTYGPPTDPMIDPIGILYESPLLYVADEGSGGALFVFDPRGDVGSVAPVQGSRGQTITNVVIGGDGFIGASAVDFGADIVVNSFVVNNKNQITCSITISPAAALGVRDVTVTTIYGDAILYGGFTVMPGPPVITSATPNSGQQGDLITGLVLHGHNFTGVDISGWIDFGQGMTVASFVVDSDNQITLDLQIQLQAVAGFRDVLITNAFSTGILPNGFTVLVATGAIPTVTSVTPDSGDQGTGPFTVVIAGTNFTGATDVLISGLGVYPGAITVDSDIQITIDFSVDLTAIAGLRAVSVTNAIGTGTG